MIASRNEIRGEAVACHYDELDEFYRDVWGEHVHHGLWLRGNESREVAVRQLVELVAREARIERGSRVCDIGCGYGATARMLVEDRGAEVSAITISPRQHAFAQTRADGRANPEWHLGDWLGNDFPRESFDAAFAIESSEHMADKPRFFTEALRVLRPGARLVVCAWLSSEHPSARAERWLLEPICREGRMPGMGSASEYRRLGVEAGFECERVEDVSDRVSRTWPTIVLRFVVKLASRPSYLKFLFNRHAGNRVFAVTILRIWIAYRVGAMRYGVFTFVKSAARAENI